MNLLVVGASHRTAPVELLERLSVAPGATASVLDDLVGTPHVNEAVVLSTCNRVEIYAAVTAFHGGLADIGGALAARAGLDISVLAANLYVHYDGEAVGHAFRVAAGLDSMVVGEAQILGQLRDAYGIAATSDAAGRLLHELMQQALRVGKRVHAETGIDRAGQNLVGAALAVVPGGVTGRAALVVGAGSMGALALATLSRAGAGRLVVANRATDRARRLATSHGARAIDLADLGRELSTVDLVVCATASPGPVLTLDTVRDALARRGVGRPLVILDLAVPRDVSPDVAELPGVTLVDLGRLGVARLDGPPTPDRDEAEMIVAGEAQSFRTWLRGADAAPAVAALRARADEVVAGELRRLAQRRPDLTADQRSEIAHALRRVVQQLLHSPSVRVRQLATTPGGDRYVTALRELFDLSVSGTDVGRAVLIDARAESTGHDDHDDGGKR